MENRNHNKTALASRPYSATTTSELSDRAEKLGTVIAKYRMSQGWNPLQPDDQMAMVGVWLELLDADGVPPERYDDCYKAEMSRRGLLKAGGKDVSPMTADDLCARWREVRQMHVEIDKSRLLTENASAACQRCFGTGREEMPDGSSKPDCDHSPLTDVEIKDRVAAKARSVEFMRAAMRMVQPAKPELREIRPVPKGHLLKCSNCSRELNTLGGVQVGEPCTWILKEVGTPATRCDGVFIETGKVAPLR